MKKCSIFFALALFGSRWLAAAQTVEIKKVPVSSTRPDSGVEMFKTYCAACHGVDGKGDSPAAGALKVTPPDLTMLAHTNGGKYPAAQVVQVITGTDAISAHGGSEMPFWGPVFHSLSPSNDAIVKLRIANLVKYIESLQK